MCAILSIKPYLYKKYIVLKLATLRYFLFMSILMVSSFRGPLFAANAAL